MSNIKLSGSEITVLKTLGLSGSPAVGKLLMNRVKGIEDAELLDTLQGLIQMGYVLASKEGLRKVAEMETVTFRVNASYSRELEEAIDPRKAKPKKKVRQRRS